MNMEIYLAGTSSYSKFMFAEDSPGRVALEKYKPNLLESFATMGKDVEFVREIAPSNFMLDSGAFSYMNGQPTDKVDWDEYVSRYIDYINQKDVKLYYELDIDSIVGYDRVLEIRKHIENNTNTPPIPVWHKSRRVDEFKKMCKDYDYVAIGGFVTQEIKKTEYDKIPALINYAHKCNCKIHGLGFTSAKWLQILHFDSVDSTGWLSGTKFKGCYKFNGVELTKIPLSDNLRIKDYKSLGTHNFIEWCKFIEYARRHL